MTTVYFIDNRSLLVSTGQGIIRAYCPLNAICITNDLNEFSFGDRIKITSVFHSSLNHLDYEVNGNRYPYNYFALMV